MEKQKKVYVKGLSLKKPHPNAPKPTITAIAPGSGIAAMPSS